MLLLSSHKHCTPQTAARPRFLSPTTAAPRKATATAAVVLPRRLVITMVEGHQCHRVGHAHRRLLLGKRFLATSPNGRFAEGAAAISGKMLSRIEIHGKNLFYFFSNNNANTQLKPAVLGAGAAVLQPFDEDPLQPGALDSDNDGGGDGDEIGALATPAAAAAAGPSTPGSSRRSSRQNAAAATTTPTKAALASMGAAAAAALNGGRGSPTAAAAGSLAPHTLVSRRRTTASPSSPTAATPAAAAAGGGGGPDAENENDDDAVVVHIHFGMSGAFRTSSLPGPEPTPTTRLRLVHQQTGMMAHLSAMTVAHGGMSLYQEKVSKLGPDPLRPDDDAERFWARVQGSKKPIGLLLMDQTAIAGVGNIYRAEILYKTGLHPEQPGHTVDRDTFEVLWGHCVDLLQRGFTSGSILTVDPEDARLLGKPWTRRYIYNQRQCGRCKGPVKIWDMAARTVYCCETCQPLRLPNVATNTTAAAAAGKPGSKKGRSRSAPAGALDAAAEAAAAAAQLLHPSRLKSMAAARVAQEFVSHCAPDDPQDLQPSKMTCQQLRDHLRGLNLDTRGNKPQLVARLEAAKGWMTQQQQEGPSAAAADEETELVGSDDSGDELDRAEGALAARLSVPPAKRRRRAAASSRGQSTQDDNDDTLLGSDAGAAAAAGGGGVGSGSRRPRRSSIASARAAEVEKEAAGENRAVEHVALHADEWTDALMFGGGEDGGEAGGGGEGVGAATPAATKPKRARRT